MSTVWALCSITAFQRKENKLPNNRRSAELRLLHLKRRFLMDSRYYQDCRTFMTDVIVRGEAESVPSCSNCNDCIVWYIPYHGVYDPNKPEKIRDVFVDCVTKFQGTSLNDQLLQGPDQQIHWCKFYVDSA